MKHIHDLAISELGRLLCGRFTLRQLGPDEVPVVRAKVLTRDGAASQSFDCCAVAGVGGCSSCSPVADRGLADAERGCQATYAAEQFDGVINSVHASSSLK